MARVCSLAALLVLAVFADDREALRLPELLVTGEASGGENAAVRATSVERALGSVRGLSLAVQGIGGQNDLSIQGSSFSGAGLCLEGLALRNPQTEHFHSELPVLPEVFGSIALRTGIDQQARTGTHLAGCADLGLATLVSGGRLTLGAGEFSAWDSTLYAAHAADVGQGALGLAAFAASADSEGDPWRDNGLRRSLAGLHMQYLLPDWRLDLLAAHGDKTFGARGYYGAPAALPSEENLRDSLLFASARRGDLAAEYVRLSCAWRELRDLYLLDASRPWLYRNEHRSRLLSLAADGRLALDESWSVLGRAELEREELDSTYRGSIVAHSLGRHWRGRATALLMPEYRAGDWRLAAGLRATGFTDDRPAWLPAAGLAWIPRPGTEVSLAYSETVRLPSYTELNYDSPTSLGNAGLARQHARSVELAATAPLAEDCHLRAQAFYRRETDAVDWTKERRGDPWQAANLRSLGVLGLALGIEARVGASLRIGLDGQILRKRAHDEPHASRYALDYPEASCRATVAWQAAPWCELRFEQNVARWRDNPERSAERTACIGAVEAVLRPPRHPRLALSFGLDNLWNQSHQPLPGVDAPGRRARVSLACEW